MTNSQRGLNDVSQGRVAVDGSHMTITPAGVTRIYMAPGWTKEDDNELFYEHLFPVTSSFKDIHCAWS